MVINKSHPYFGISIAFTTMHKKEYILSPLFEKKFAAKLVVPADINTDLLGTFTGEIKREHDIKAVLRKKAKLGINKTGLQFGIASEGSFGPHPRIPFIECNQETLIFVDTKKQIEIFSHYISMDNKAEYAEVSTIDEIKLFFQRFDFGDQGVIVKPSYESNESVFKGLTTKDEVFDAIKMIQSRHQTEKVWIETDNRAHMNPKRRLVIARAAEVLIEKLISICPDCASPGFEMTDVTRGLACGDCGIKSDKPLNEIWSCPNKKCEYQEIKDRADGLKELDPAECDFCNP